MMRIGSLLLVLCVGPLLLAQKDKEKKPEAKPNTLSAKEAADGWLLLFDGETTFGWTIDGEAKVEKGELVVGGAKKTTLTTTAEFGPAVVRLYARGQAIGLRFHDADQSHTWTGDAWQLVSAFRDQKAVGSLRVGPQGLERLEGQPAKPLTATSPVRLTVSAGEKVRLRDIAIQPLHTEPLFNGKDLAGWKAFKGNPKQEKSKFTVTKEGWLHVKDGPGDLQTEKHFANFVLQLECLSNGAHLNSGVFFRCVPDQYQQGYEAQIHNGWLDRPKDITVDDYDPAGMKAFKRAVKTTAMDFGTGGIYRRQPARKAVARDKEWFTMTVVARGRHMATWVNGVQQVDWVDHRPEADNARQGYRAKAGAISIQGHDPTTDLSFRQIRVGALP